MNCTFSPLRLVYSCRSLRTALGPLAWDMHSVLDTAFSGLTASDRLYDGSRQSSLIVIDLAERETRILPYEFVTGGIAASGHPTPTPTSSWSVTL